MRPVGRLRSLLLLLLPLVAALAAGCAGTGGGTAAAPPACRPPGPGAGDPAEANAVAVAYLTQLAGQRYDRAQRFALACTPAAQRSLQRLWLWLASMPIQEARVAGVHVRRSTVPGHRRELDVQATLYARFGSPPYSAWVTLGARTLRLGRQGTTWRVRGDASTARRSDLGVYGLCWQRHPYFANGLRATVVYASPADATDARAILSTADAVAPGLFARYGGGGAARRPLIFLIDNRRQGERLAHVDLGKVRTPAGFQYSAFAYVDLPLWRGLDPVLQRSMVMHELTHVATRPALSGAPHSLLEGIAMYEESEYIRAFQKQISLDPIAVLYYRHAFPGLRIWERRETDWGLTSKRAISLAYLDALAMTRAIVERFGRAGVVRLGAAFRAERVRRDFTAAEVERAFRRGLGVSFADVAARARADAIAQYGTVG
jgi:hypothetical protein